MRGNIAGAAAEAVFEPAGLLLVESPMTVSAILKSRRENVRPANLWVLFIDHMLYIVALL